MVNGESPRSSNEGTFIPYFRPYFGGEFPYVGLIYGMYLQVRFLKWPLTLFFLGKNPAAENSGLVFLPWNWNLVLNTRDTGVMQARLDGWNYGVQSNGILRISSSSLKVQTYQTIQQKISEAKLLSIKLVKNVALFSWVHIQWEASLDDIPCCNVGHVRGHVEPIPQRI